ncbi:hypothetical protein GCM10020220_005570 [Nonomuraea rubra]
MIETAVTNLAWELPWRRGRTGAARRGAVTLVAVLAVVGAASLAVGARALSPGEVWHGLFGAPGGDQRLSEITLILRTVRVPRTVLAIAAGAALGVGGALIQGFTRNPIADTGLLGVNSGASFAVVTVIMLFGLSNPFQYVWFAFLGAAAAGVVVFGLSSLGRGGSSPLTLALTGQGVTVFLAAMTTAIALSDPASLNALRFWNAGSVAGVGFDVIWPVTAFIAAGLVLALSTLPAVNLLNLGEGRGRGAGREHQADQDRRRRRHHRAGGRGDGGLRAHRVPRAHGGPRGPVPHGGGLSLAGAVRGDCWAPSSCWPATSWGAW